MKTFTAVMVLVHPRYVHSGSADCDVLTVHILAESKEHAYQRASQSKLGNLMALFDGELNDLIPGSHRPIKL